MQKYQSNVVSIYLASYSLDVDLIPRPNEHGCPSQTSYKEGIGSCNCEDHCSWDLCRLTVPPTRCIEGTNSEWHWDDTKSAWVAQVNTSTICSAIITILFLLKLVKYVLQAINYVFSKVRINIFGVARTFTD